MDIDDLLSEPVVVNSRARVKFQPKARPKSNVKVAIVSASGQCDSTKDKPVITDFKHPDTSRFASRLELPIETASVNPMLSSVDALSGMPQLRHPLSSTETLQQECSESAGGKISGLVDVSTQLATSKDEIAIDPTFQGNTNNLDIRGDKQAGFERSGGETADIFCELESLDTLSQSAISNVSTMRKFQPKMIINAQPRNKLPVSGPIISEAACSISCRDTPSHQGYRILEEGLASVASVPTASASSSVNNNPDFLVVPQDVFNSREATSSDNHGDGVSWMGDRRVEKEVEAFDNFTSEARSNMGNVHLVRPANEYLEEDLTPAYPQDGFTDFSTMGFSDSLCRDTHLELQAAKDLENHAEISFPNVVTHEDFRVSQARHLISGKEDDRPILAASKEIEIGKSSRKLRNKVVAADETSEDFTVNENDDNDEAFNGKDTPNLKNTCQTLKKLAPGLEKTGSGRKKAAEGSETLDKEPPKKKFSHSTRRNKRRVDKVLLETLEHEINPRKLILKDLILLAEAKERLLVADPNAANNSSPYQSTTFTQDTLFEEEVPFAYEEDQAEHFVQPKLNYHTFMNKTSKERWSQQDTDLFYEGIQQFGTDFALTQQLFPGRTRHQVKSKYKKEELKQSRRLSYALANPSKNHSHFKLVIERLQKAAADAEADHDSDRDDESVGITGEEEEITPNTNEEASKKHDENETNFEEEDVGEGMMEAEQVAIMNHQGYSPAKSHQESEGDVYDIWSEYKSDI
ncbi:hypothetical protein MKX01_033254 [Papaver californicum]|nr:hypothetical protein MKX01_033254 [Papaver californicum]